MLADSHKKDQTLFIEQLVINTLSESRNNHI